MPRYSLIALVMSLIAIAVVAKSAYIMIVQKNYWLEVAAKQKKDKCANFAYTWQYFEF